MQAVSNPVYAHQLILLNLHLIKLLLHLFFKPRSLTQLANYTSLIQCAQYLVACGSKIRTTACTFLANLDTGFITYLLHKTIPLSKYSTKFCDNDADTDKESRIRNIVLPITRALF